MRNVRHISHRGGSAERPENTIEAFRHALRQGSQMLELDVRLTKDNQVVVFHDASLKRLTGLDKLVNDVCYADLPKQFKPSIGVGIFAEERLETREYDTHIPLLEEVFQQFPGVPINIDLKDCSPVLVDEVYKLIKQYSREDLVVWGSFSEVTARMLYEKAPNVPLMCSARRILTIILCYYLGILPFLPIRESFFEIPMYQNVPPALGFLGKVLVWLVKNVLGNPRLFDHLNRRGITVYSWVQNSMEDFEFCYFHKRVNGMMTDKPTLLSEFCSKHSLIKVD